MEMRERAICAIASFTALTFSGLVTKFSKAGMNCGLTQDEVVEVVIQTGPYTGLAPVLMGLAALSA
jgi:alkylhydroperoxidase/carboxymuconolactone decarboxylase family protein YurZ